MNRILTISLWSVTLLGLMVLLGFVDKEQERHPCTGVEISVDRSNGNFFVEEEELDEWIKNLYDVDSTSIATLDLLDLEERLNANASIEQAQVYTTVNGKLRVEVTQRTPLLRVFSNSGSSYYIDQEGWLMPLSRNYTSRVMVANGAIDANFDVFYKFNVSEWGEAMDTVPELAHLHRLYSLADRISEDPFWKAQINQVYLTEGGDLELIPRVGNHRIILGDINDIDQKLRKLMVFYKKGLTRTGWNEYSEINLKFRNQVVCTKK